jgi:hypothetical protein
VATKGCRNLWLLRGEGQRNSFVPISECAHAQSQIDSPYPVSYTLFSHRVRAGALTLRRLLAPLLVVLSLCSGHQASWAQAEARLQPGDPPRAALISISAPDEDGIVTLHGEAGAVFSTAYVAVRNLYTQETVFVQAGITGSFSISLFGPGSTPFLIVPATDAPTQATDYPGSLPGGPGAILYGSNPTSDSGTAFTTAGSTAGSRWSAQGHVNTLALEPGDLLFLRLEVTFDPALPPETPFAVQLSLTPVATQNGAVADAYSNNGWSNVVTPSNLAVDNLTGGVHLGEASLQPDAAADSASSPAFPVEFEVMLPDDLPKGLYVPVLTVSGADRPARLPLVLNVGDFTAATLPIALLMDDPSDGSRGLLSVYSDLALSNRVRFNSQTYVLPPGEYPLEPYLPSLLPNRYDLTLPPLLPFQFPGGSLSVQVTRPDNSRDEFNNLTIQQNRLSTAAEDEADLFGPLAPVDIYRLDSGAPELAAYPFDQYGEYRVRLAAVLEDLWGNRYTGGGEYAILIAEPLDLTPGVLPGTPFEVGDPFNPTLHVAPGLPADVSIRVAVYPLDGSPMLEQSFAGQANRYGYYHTPEQGFTFETAGEYVIDYEARYLSPEGRLWAGSLRSAGVIGSPDGGLIAHGARGLAGLEDAVPHPAWYSLSHYADALDQPLDNVRLNAPYHSGDVVWLGANKDNGIQPVIRVQDSTGVYRQTLASTETDALEQPLRATELPVRLPPGAALSPPADLSYTYFSAVRPDVTARQMVIGGDEGGLLLEWNADDLYNQQIGAGVAGDQPGDYLFLFGGAVVRPLNEIALYAALAVVTADADGARVYPPGRGADGGGDGGPLVVVHDEPIEMFFHPTGIRPGESLVVGDTLAVAGQVAPTLPAAVSVTITSPSGAARSFSGDASAIGYFYDPAQDFAVDEFGVWTVDIRVSYGGLTSAGQIEPPPLVGAVLGSEMDGRFFVYVLPEASQPLPWSPQLTDITIPAALPYNFNFTAPDGWNDVRAYRTLTTASYILDEGELRLNGRSFSYPLNPTNLRLEFPNIEVEGRVSGPAAADASTLTFAFTGTDASGQPQIRTRVFTILHDRLVSLSDE